MRLDMQGNTLLGAITYRDFVALTSVLGTRSATAIEVRPGTCASLTIYNIAPKEAFTGFFVKFSKFSMKCSKFYQVFRSFRTCSDLFGRVRMLSDAFGRIWMRLDASGHFPKLLKSLLEKRVFRICLHHLIFVRIPGHTHTPLV